MALTPSPMARPEGEVESVELVPSGATELRMGALPRGLPGRRLASHRSARPMQVASQLQGSLAEADGPADGYVAEADYEAEDACASALSWEAELRAELEAM